MGWWWVAVVAVGVLAASYLSWTAGRLERLHVRVDRARAALDTQLDRRASAAARLADPRLDGTGDDLRAAALAALAAPPGQRGSAENDLTRVLRLLPVSSAGPARPGLTDIDPTLAEVVAASVRIGLARQFYNDAVRDTLALRRGRVPSAFRLGARRPLPGYFDIDTDIVGAVGADSGATPAQGDGTSGAT